MLSFITECRYALCQESQETICSTPRLFMPIAYMLNSVFSEYHYSECHVE
jgi:hypothetical protein